MTPLFDYPIEIDSHRLDEEKGQVRKYRFKNGYGASVIRFRLITPKPLEEELKKHSKTYKGEVIYGSYTKNEKEWELAVTYNGKLCYTTPITDDVIGWLKKPEVETILGQIQALPPKSFIQYWIDEIKALYKKIKTRIQLRMWRYQRRRNETTKQRKKIA